MTKIDEQQEKVRVTTNERMKNQNILMKKANEIYCIDAMKRFPNSRVRNTIKGITIYVSPIDFDKI